MCVYTVMSFCWIYIDHSRMVRTLLFTSNHLYFVAVFEPLGGVMVGSEDRTQMKPALFVISCGEGHLDLRTADKVMQTLLAKDSGQSGLPRIFIKLYATPALWLLSRLLPTPTPHPKNLLEESLQPVVYLERITVDPVVLWMV